MNNRLIALSLAGLGFALTAPSFAGVIYDDGPTNGTYNAFFIDGPNPGPYSQSISNDFDATGSGKVGQLEAGLWVLTGATPTTVTWWLGTGFLDNSIGGGTAALNASNSTFLLSNGYGYDVYDIKLTGLTSTMMTAGNHYWLTLGNANDNIGSQFVAWDVNEGPATCNFGVSGGFIGSCGDGGESFKLTTAVPEPSTVLLFSAGIIGLIGVRRRSLKA